MDKTRKELSIFGENLGEIVNFILFKKLQKWSGTSPNKNLYHHQIHKFVKNYQWKSEIVELRDRKKNFSFEI